MRIALRLAAVLAATTLPAQVTATINDPRSHGTVGDAMLSLDEAIRLANGTLLPGALSATERNQLAGTGVVARLVIDGARTPQITLERLLSDVVGQHHSHLHVEIEGVDGPAGTPVIEGGSQLIVLPLRTNHAHVHNLVLRGGLAGVDYDSTLHYHPSEVAELGRVRIEDARDVGLRVRNPRINGSQAPIRLHEVDIHGSDIGVAILDDSQFGNTEVFAEQVAIADCTAGVVVAIDSMGGDHLLQMLRCEFTGVARCLLVGRVSPASDSRWRVRCVHGSYRAGDRAFEIATNAAGSTALELHHLDLHAGIQPASAAMIAGPQNGHLALLATECNFRGPVQIAAGTASSAVRLHNDRFESGALGLSLSAGSGDVAWCNFTACPIDLAPACSSLVAPIGFTGCELVRSDLNDRSTGRSRLTGCFLGGSVLSGNVQNLLPQLTPWIGRASVAPPNPPLGTFVDLTVDLHPGTAAIWLLGTTVQDPITSAMPFRFYLAMPSAIVLPGLYQGWSRLRLPIPNTPSLRGAAFYAQPVQAPTQGQPQVPPLFLPLGGEIEIQ